MARAQGINTNIAKVLGLMISNGLVALAGGLLAQYQGFSDINMGRGAIVIGLAAVIIGEVIFSQYLPQLCPASCCPPCIGAIIYYIVILLVLRLGLYYRRPEAAHRFGGGAVPGHPVLEGQILHQDPVKKEEQNHA